MQDQYDRLTEISRQASELSSEDYDKALNYEIENKIMEMAEGAELMHGEAVNIDGFLCVVLAQRRGMISAGTRDRILAAMSSIGLPTLHSSVCPEVLEKGLADAVEHRNGAQRIPLLTGIGSSVCVNDITPEELHEACIEMWALHAHTH